MLSVKKLAIKREVVDGLDIVRVKESKFGTIVSERLMNEISKLKLTGMDFLEVKVV